MCDAPAIVDALLEDEIDAKEFLLRHPSKKVYREVAFFQGRDADEILDIVEQLGEDEALLRMAEDYDTGEGRTSDEQPWGSEDSIHWGEFDGTTYALSVNRRMSYVGLCAVENRI